MKGVIYARYSSDNQREESIEGQIRECKAFAEKNGIDIIEIYIDRALSAKTDNRPDFQRLIKESGSKKFEVLLVWKLDRFARNKFDSAHYKRILKNNGVHVVSATEVISDGPEGILLESLLEGMAEYYSADLSEKVMRGQTENALKCMYNGGTLPIGYVIDKEQHFQIDPVAAPLVLQAFTDYSNGKSMREVTDMLNLAGIRTKRGGKVSINSVTRMLHNRRYIGEYQYRDVIHPHGIPAIIPEDLFERVQERLAKAKKAPAKFKAEDEYLLTTKLFCGKCNCYMAGESGTSHTGIVHRYYKCVSVKNHKGCDKKSVQKEWIENLVIDQIKKILFDDEMIEKLADMGMERQRKENTVLPMLKRQLAETEKGIRNFVDAIQQGIITESTKERLEGLEKAKRELSAQIAREELLQPPEFTRDQFLFWFERMRKYDTTKLVHRRRLIDSFVNAIYLYDDRITLVFNFKDGTKTITFAELEESSLGSDINALAAPTLKPCISTVSAFFSFVENAFFANKGRCLPQFFPRKRPYSCCRALHFHGIIRRQADTDKTNQISSTLYQEDIAMFDYQNPALSADARAADLLGRMTLEEKAAQTCMMRGVEYATKPDPRQHCSVEPDTEFDTARLEEDFGGDGIGFIHDMYSTPAAFNRIQRYFIENSRLGIPAIFTGEALHGISGVRGTVFPTPLNFGATFDPELIRRVGGAIGRETRALGMHEILAPNLDVARESRWGRIEETFGEDTYLSSRMAAAIISGEQKGDVSRPDAVIAEPKHYCVHGIAEGGTNCSPARAGRREVESCYLPVFEAGVREGGAYNVMVSYNCVDGDPLMCSEWYLKDVLKKRFGLRGYARSDWGGVGRLKSAHHLVSTDEDAIGLALRNGLDVQGCDYPPVFWKKTVVSLVKAGKLSVERLDDIVFRVLRVKFELGLFERPYTDEKAWEGVIRCEEHRALSHEVARESLVLLKNNGVLPLKKNLRSVALIGPSSAAQKIGGYSSTPQFPIPSLYEELKAALGEDVTVRQCNGCAITYDKKQPRVVDGQPHLYSEGEEEIADEMEEALSIAASCDAILFVGGDNTVTSGEGHDRCELTLNGRQRELIEQLASLGKPLILVVENGKPLDLSRENEVCDAILMAFFGGETGARAIAEALTGVFSPAGRLPLSLPRSSTRIPCYYSMLPGGAENFLEGPKNALFPFGYGLSYTEFEYADLAIEQTGERRFTVSCDVKNVGDMDGDEVVQLYLDDADSSVVTPPLLLKGFQRVHLKAGEETRVSFPLDETHLKLMDIRYEWTVEPGRFRVLVGAGSRDLRLEGEFTVE